MTESIQELITRQRGLVKERDALIRDRDALVTDMQRLLQHAIQIATDMAHSAPPILNPGYKTIT